MNETQQLSHKPNTINLYAMVDLGKRFPLTMVLPENNKSLKPEIVAKEVSVEFLVPMVDIRGKSRKSKLVDARRALVMCLSIMCPEMSTTIMGMFLNLNHTSIIYHRKQHKNILQHYPDSEYAQKYAKIMDRLILKRRFV